MRQGRRIYLEQLAGVSERRWTATDAVLYQSSAQAHSARRLKGLVDEPLEGDLTDVEYTTDDRFPR